MKKISIFNRLLTIFTAVFIFFLSTSVVQADSPSIFTGEYFDNVNLSGTPVLTRQDESIQFDWGESAPAPEVPAESFSVRWTGTQFFPAGQYRFLMTGDDGVRLFLDGELIINGWVNQSATSYATIVTLTEGEHQLVMEHYDGGYSAVAKLEWQAVEASSQQKIMPLGDSITHGYNVDGGYRTKLYQLLPGINLVGSQNSGPSELADKDHEGHPGWRIDEISQQIQPWLVASNPDSILLLIGTNDVLQNFQLDTAIQRYDQLVTKITQVSPTANIFVATLPPLTNETQNAQVQTLNQQISNLVQQKQTTNSHFYLVDMYDALTLSDLADGVHPSQAGYEKMAETWQAAIESVGTPSPTPTPTPTPSIEPSENYFVGEYFNNADLLGTASLVRADDAVNFDWGTGVPSPTLNPDNFSVRWSKPQTLAAGTYRFTVTADDGVRLKIDDNVVIDQWVNQPPTSYAVNLELAAGQHQIVMEYYEKGGGAVAQLQWENVSPSENLPDPTQEYVAEYFNNLNVSGTPELIRGENEVNHTWQLGSPDAVINSNYFSARWTRQISVAEDGVYRFTVTADDGVRLKIDNIVVIDRWVDQAATTYTVEKLLTTGDHTFVVEYYEKEWDATAKFSWNPVQATPTPTPVDPSQVFFAEYYDNTNLEGSPILTSYVDFVDYSWGDGSPSAEVPTNYFSARWTKTVNLEAGQYRFSVTADDGVRLKVDGQVILDRWIDQAPTTYTPEISLPAGDHQIVMEYYEKEWDATAKLAWEKVGEYSTPLPTMEFQADYFNSLDLSGSPALTRTESGVDHVWGTQAPSSEVDPDTFSARFTAQPDLDAGNYVFSVTADDGVRLKIDGNVVIDQWINQSATTYQTTQTLSAGTHTITIEYYEAGYDATLIFDWAKQETL